MVRCDSYVDATVQLNEIPIRWRKYETHGRVNSELTQQDGRGKKTENPVSQAWQ